MSSDRIKIVWIYPDLLSTYGDQGNTIVLERRSALRGIPTETLHLRSDEPVPTDGDIYLLGGGEDRPQILAAQRLRGDGGLQRAAQRGAVIFAVCAGFQIIGHEFGGEEGQLLPGLGILDIRSGRGQQRAVGEVVGDVSAELNIPRITGFENHMGATSIGPGAKPLAKVVAGTGNGDGNGFEGAYSGRVVGTYMHGPALVRNPALADLLLTWAVGAQLQPIDDSWAGRLREERLNAVLA
ncbi:type 1 glutamine amidotransferase [Actinomadura rubrisoli]|uniref:Lipid II isoglutaminyl synthase (glutamine-hydrolyzing) subunit GatD n=1 Tax=Actinomadura rubrisoli TaxID=2530368 RepID=A0A4R4ZRU0_9ACTN|nr:glutamine amidotransferase [Actinomadura rubrisoli]TDD60804.1 glutamine amidotransferase [Actinomadura rubrisoli]